MSKAKRIVAGCLITGPLLCCGGGWLLLRATFGSAASSRTAELAKTRAAHIPTEPADLAALARVPDGENAALIYRPLIPSGDKGPYDADLALVNKALANNPASGAVEQGRAALVRLQPMIAIVKKGAELPHCDFRHDWSKGSALLFSEFAPAKGWAKTLCFEAEQRSEHGDWRGALDDIRLANRIGKQIGETPIMIGLLVRVAIDSIDERSFDRVVDEHAGEAAFVAAARKIHDEFEPLPLFRRSMYGELVLNRATIANLKTLTSLDGTSESEEKSKGMSFERMVVSSSLIRDAFDAKMLEAYRNFILSLPEDPAKWSEAERAAKAFDTKNDADQSMTNILNRILFPVFDQATLAIGKMQMRHRLTDTALRILSDRARGGGLPKYLPNYGDARIDPFSGDPLKYRHEDKGFLLYSVGMDRVDDGGRPRDPHDSAKTYDEILRIH